MNIPTPEDFQERSSWNLAIESPYAKHNGSRSLQAWAMTDDGRYVLLLDWSGSVLNYRVLDLEQGEISPLYVIARLRRDQWLEAKAAMRDLAEAGTWARRDPHRMYPVTVVSVLPPRGL